MKKFYSLFSTYFFHLESFLFPIVSSNQEHLVHQFLYIVQTYLSTLGKYNWVNSWT